MSKLLTFMLLLAVAYSFR